jgi:hypothetical protein
MEIPDIGSPQETELDVEGQEKGLNLGRKYHISHLTQEVMEVKTET